MNLIAGYGLRILEQKSGDMNCVICKSGNMKEGQVTVTLQNDGSIILIKEVPANICDVCGHYYLDESTTREVLQRGNEGLRKGAELEVLKLRAAI